MSSLTPRIDRHMRSIGAGIICAIGCVFSMHHTRLMVTIESIIVSCYVRTQTLLAKIELFDLTTRVRVHCAVRSNHLSPVIASPLKLLDRPTRWAMLVGHVCPCNRSSFGSCQGRASYHGHRDKNHKQNSDSFFRDLHGTPFPSPRSFTGHPGTYVPMGWQAVQAGCFDLGRFPDSMFVFVLYNFIIQSISCFCQPSFCHYSNSFL